MQELCTITKSTAVHSTYPHGWDGPKGNLFKEDDDLFIKFRQNSGNSEADDVPRLSLRALSSCSSIRNLYTMTMSTPVHSTYPHGWDGPKGNLFKEDDDLNYDQDALNRTASKDPSSTKKSWKSLPTICAIFFWRSNIVFIFTVYLKIMSDPPMTNCALCSTDLRPINKHWKVVF